MASYKYSSFLQNNTSEAFDSFHAPGSEAINAGIYRCSGCGDEIAIAKGHTLPPQNHHQHAVSAGKITWQLIVFPTSKQ
jgi:hypothetical protein